MTNRKLPKSVSPRMKSGLPAEKFIPWQAIIYWKNGFSCGGTIISRRTILTSARCLHHSSKSWPDCYDPDHPIMKNADPFVLKNV